MPLNRRSLLGLSPKNAQGNTLVCVFQRGAADGLNCVVPHGDDDYYVHRPRIAIPRPGQTTGALDLDGFFGLHPAAASLRPLYDAGRLALVHATGVPHGSRSHFDAQTLVEAGVTNKGAIATGWLGRHLLATARLDDPVFRAVAISGSVPLSLRGAPDPLAVADVGAFGLGELGGTDYQQTLSTLYGPQHPYAAVAQSAFGAMDALALADPGQFQAENGAQYPPGESGSKLLQAAQLIKAELGCEIICIDIGGWDHHENANNFLPASLGRLSDALAAFDTDLGTRMQHVTVLVLTEFGRRVRENISAGTDHGAGHLLYALGAGVNGAQVHGTWPGLGPADLEVGEDLAITTDLRDLLITCLERRLGNSLAATLFPEHTLGNPPSVFL